MEGNCKKRIAPHDVNPSYSSFRITVQSNAVFTCIFSRVGSKSALKSSSKRYEQYLTTLIVRFTNSEIESQVFASPCYKQRAPNPSWVVARNENTQRMGRFAWLLSELPRCHYGKNERDSHSEWNSQNLLEVWIVLLVLRQGLTLQIGREHLNETNQTLDFTSSEQETRSTQYKTWFHIFFLIGAWCRRRSDEYEKEHRGYEKENRSCEKERRVSEREHRGYEKEHWLRLGKGTRRLRKGTLTEVTKRNTDWGYEKEHRGYEKAHWPRLRKGTLRLRKGTLTEVRKRTTEVTKRNTEVTKRNTERGYEKEHWLRLRKGTPRLRKGAVTEVTKRNTDRRRLRRGTLTEVTKRNTKVTKRNTDWGYEKEHWLRLRKGTLTEVTKRNTDWGYEKEHWLRLRKGTLTEVTRRNTDWGYEKEHRGYEKEHCTRFTENRLVFVEGLVALPFCHRNWRQRTDPQASRPPEETKTDQFQNSPSDSREILHYTVRRTWLCTAYSDERWWY